MQYAFGEKSWTATLTSDRRLTVETAREKRVFLVSESQIQKLDDVIARERFFELNSDYGQAERDVDFRTIALTANGQAKTVAVYATLGRETRRAEVARALRVAIAIRSLFDWSAALDTREEDAELVRSLSE